MKAILFAAGAIAAIVTATLSSTPATHATSTDCASATDRSNIVYTWNSNSEITVTLKKPVCTDLSLYFSSYEMPDTWDQKGFNSTAVPQTWKASDGVVFKANEAVSTKTMTVKLPDACKNAQIDLYFGPEITNLPNTGHGAQYISHKFQTMTGECETPVVPVTPVTPETPTTPPELPHTGPVSLIAILAPSAAALAYIALSIRQDILARQK